MSGDEQPEPGIDPYLTDTAKELVRKCRAQITPALFAAANKAGHTLFDGDRSGFVSTAQTPQEVTYCIATPDEFLAISEDWGRWNYAFSSSGEPVDDFWETLERDGEVHASENSGEFTMIVTVKKPTA